MGFLQRLVKTLAWSDDEDDRNIRCWVFIHCWNIFFLGPTEAPLLVKPYVATMTQSELHAQWWRGFATIAVRVLRGLISPLVYQNTWLPLSSWLLHRIGELSKLLYPETEVPLTAGSVRMDVNIAYVNVIDAAATGALDRRNWRLTWQWWSVLWGY